MNRTFRGADEVLAVVQYWLNDIMVIADIYDPALRHRPGLCAAHRPAQRLHLPDPASGLQCRQFPDRPRRDRAARLFDRPRGRVRLRGQRPRHALERDARKSPAGRPVARLRSYAGMLERSSACWRNGNTSLDGKYQAAAPGEKMSPRRRRASQWRHVQLGLKSTEIARVQKLLAALLGRIDRGEITTY